MEFSERQIELAKQLKDLGLPWTPALGHYVYDVSGRVQLSSPFQDHVFFILDYDRFVDQLGGIKQLKESMIWMPLWRDAREILRSMGVEDDEVELEIVRKSGIAKGTELLALYEMIAQQLSDTKLQAIYQHS